MQIPLYIIVIILVCFSGILQATQIPPSSLEKLQEESDLVIVAKVLSITAVNLSGRKDQPFDEVTLRIASLIKGKVESQNIKIVTEPRGMRDFDPELRIGQAGVFFLSEVEGFGFRLTQAGSVAIFERNSFILEEAKKAEPEDAANDEAAPHHD